ncbi:hypothetical protein O4215_14945 [Rhodococcus maanshanensis]|uniref:hypothetical protein n=1 Tax=Rhodococcus maanshanensis TaxID=183556 RepID=UPI0022B49721|nr:hypothetical protein [Rhodococcus maanshanensis]MCZ4556863.1 hypothetical protein [Rhodococcus maanshanensis]
MFHRRFAAAVAGAAAVVALAGGCATENAPAPAPAPSGGTGALPNTSVAPAPGGPVAGGVTQAQATQLCSDMQAQLQSWRTYTPTIGKGGLNTVVGTWAAQNGINVIELMGNKARIDAITQAQCPDVRADAIESLRIPDLASGLIGF